MISIAIGLMILLIGIFICKKNKPKYNGETGLASSMISLRSSENSFMGEVMIPIGFILAVSSIAEFIF